MTISRNTVSHASGGMPNGIAQAIQLGVRRNDSEYGGTVGALCLNQFAQPLLLTCGHVVMDAWGKPPGAVEILDGSRSLGGANRVLEGYPRKPGEVAPIDAATVLIEPRMAEWITLTLPQLLPSGVGGSLIRGEALALQTSRGVIGGRYSRSLGTVSLETPDGSSYLLAYAHGYLADQFPEGGDSGAALHDARGRLVGLHCGIYASPDGEFNALFCEIGAILARLQVTVVIAGQRISAEAAPAKASAVASTLPSPTAGTVVETVARTIWAEAGRAGPLAMEAVAHVIANRKAFGKWHGHEYIEVCLKPFQFPCWDRTSLTTRRLLPVEQPLRLEPRERKAYAQAYELANKVVSSDLAGVIDPTKGATHYHPEWLAARPDWTKGKVPSLTTSGLVFYSNID